VRADLEKKKVEVGKRRAKGSIQGKTEAGKCVNGTLEGAGVEYEDGHCFTVAKTRKKRKEKFLKKGMGDRGGGTVREVNNGVGGGGAFGLLSRGGETNT